MKWTCFDALCLSAAIILLVIWLEVGLGARIPGGLKLCAVMLVTIGLIAADNE